MDYNLSKKDVNNLNGKKPFSLPKYTSGVINDGNRYSQATRPEKVGQLSELFPQFLSESEDTSIEAWKAWYLDRYPNKIDEATDTAYTFIQKMVAAISQIDRDLVNSFIEDLIINKTYYGLYYQKAILIFLAKQSQQDYRLATPEEESLGIDGFVGETAYSVKSITYKSMQRLQEDINVKMVYYTETNDGIIINVED